MTEELEGEVNEMCNLSEALVELGIERGIEQGIEQGKRESKEFLVQMMLKDNEPMEKIERYTGCTEQEIREIAEKCK